VASETIELVHRYHRDWNRGEIDAVTAARLGTDESRVGAILDGADEKAHRLPAGEAER
jgi:hypothetical protein